jgi:hypothetical protein
MVNMAKGMALTIGINSVDPKQYAGWSGELAACEFDAVDYANIAKSNNFQVKTLFTKEATRKHVIDEISKAAKALESGDIFMLSYSGHGGQVPDCNGDEEDGMDETMCLYDGQLIDDELNAQFAKFAEGVRVLVFSDSCHSGTVTKVAFLNSTGITNPQTRYRNMPIDIGMRVYIANKTFYDKILKDKSLKNAEDDIKASVLLISGCQDNQLSMDGDSNGLFTSQLKHVWNHGSYDKNYRQFYDEIYRLMPPFQQPNYYRTGMINPKFEKGKVFEI